MFRGGRECCKPASSPGAGVDRSVSFPLNTFSWEGIRLSRCELNPLACSRVPRTRKPGNLGTGGTARWFLLLPLSDDQFVFMVREAGLPAWAVVRYNMHVLEPSAFLLHLPLPVLLTWICLWIVYVDHLCIFTLFLCVVTVRIYCFTFCLSPSTLHGWQKWRLLKKSQFHEYHCCITLQHKFLWCHCNGLVWGWEYATMKSKH